MPRLPAASMPPLFGLAPGGVCHAARRCRERGALLPHLFTLTRADAGGLFSVALSLGSPPAAVSRHRRSLEPGLSSTGVLDRKVPQTGSGRPADWRLD